LVLALPLVAARHVLSVQHYAVSCALFFIAWFLLVRRIPPKRSSLVASCILFAISFITQSLLVFYLVPIVHLWHQTKVHLGLTVRAFILRYWPILTLPAVWFSIKTTLFEPYGQYAGYNELTQASLAGPTVLLLLTMLPIVGVHILAGRLSAPARSILQPAGAGLALISLAVYPYVVVGQHPPYEEWLSRHELLMPLGAALIVLAGCRIVGSVLGPDLARLFGLAAIGVAIVVSGSISASYFVDWQKQQNLVVALRATPTIAAASTIVFEDETRDVNIFGRAYRFYEWNGLMTRAFGDETRFGINDEPSDVADLISGFNRNHVSTYRGQFKARDYVPDGAVLHVTITRSNSNGLSCHTPVYVARYLMDCGDLYIETRRFATVQDFVQARLQH
jgi:hypothetical protein